MADALAIFAANGAASSGTICRRSNDVAAGLLALGVGRGDRVGIWAPNRPEWLYVQFGTARIGAILVNINPAYRTSELEYALNKVECKVLVMARRHKSSDYVEMLRALAPEIEGDGTTVRAAKLPHLKYVAILDEGPLPRSACSFASLTSRAGPGHRRRVETLSAALVPTRPSISSSQAARRARRKAQRSAISTSSTMRDTPRSAWHCPARIGSVFRYRFTIASAWF